MAHITVELVAGLSLYSAWRQPPWPRTDVPQPRDRDVPGRFMAWPGMEIRVLGYGARAGPLDRAVGRRVGRAQGLAPEPSRNAGHPPLPRRIRVCVCDPRLVAVPHAFGHRCHFVP